MIWNIRPGAVRITVAVLAALVAATGCAHSQHQDLTSDSFRHAPAGAPAKAVSDPADPPFLAPAVDSDRVTPSDQGSRIAAWPILPLVEQQVQSPIPATAPAMASGPATQPVHGIPSGQYMCLGGVVAKVNGAPIYANKVLTLLQSPLAARAKELDADQFQMAATTLIDNQTHELIRSELEFAAAERQLDDSDKQLAKNLTVEWRQKQITQAGGSQEVCRRKAAAAGTNFDESVQQQYRLYMTQLFYQRKVLPKVQVTVNDMRRYYSANLDSQFVVHDQAKFCEIKIDPRAVGGRDAALEKMKQVAKRAAAGENFADLAGEANTDGWLQQNHGEVGWTQRGAFSVEQVEAAVWDLKPGQISDIIDAGGNFYLAKLEDRKIGKTLPFDDQAVQAKINELLRSEQFQALRTQVQEKLWRSAVVDLDPRMLQTTVQMAMQAYGQLAGH